MHMAFPTCQEPCDRRKSFEISWSRRFGLLAGRSPRPQCAPRSPDPSRRFLPPETFPAGTVLRSSGRGSRRISTLRHHARLLEPTIYSCVVPKGGCPTGVRIGPPHVILRLPEQSRRKTMRELHYTTPHGIAVTRKLSKAHFVRACGIFCANSTATAASTFPRDMNIPGGIRAGTSPPPARRSKSFRTTATSNFARSIERGDRIAADSPSRAGRPSALGGIRLRPAAHSTGRLKPMPRAVSRGGAQQAALRLFHSAHADRRVPRREIRASA